MFLRFCTFSDFEIFISKIIQDLKSVIDNLVNKLFGYNFKY